MKKSGRLAKRNMYLKWILYVHMHFQAHLVLELLAELQGDGEEYQRIIEPRHHTLHLVNVAHFKPVVVELAVEGKCSQRGEIKRTP